MSHECPECGKNCDCDGEDTYMELLDPADCECPCWEEADEEIEEVTP
jgi:hypothetical protein